MILLCLITFPLFISFQLPIAKETSLTEVCLWCADDSVISDIPTVSNVRQDLTEFQEKHAKFVLSSVKV